MKNLCILLVPLYSKHHKFTDKQSFLTCSFLQSLKFSYRQPISQLLIHRVNFLTEMETDDIAAIIPLQMNEATALQTKHNGSGLVVPCDGQ